jgi:two-component system, OmpR family, sensor kinase
MAAYALAMLLVLGGAGLFVYLRLRADLNDGVNSGQQAQVAAVAARARRLHPPRLRDVELVDPNETFVQVVAPDGRLRDSAGNVAVPVLSADQVARAGQRSLRFERRIRGFDANVRVLAESAATQRGRVVVVVGQSLGDRDEALAGLTTSFGIGGALAVVLASAIGYALARAGLAPVEAMRTRAAEVSLRQGGQRLPLPEAHDEIRRLGETLNEMLDRLERSFAGERRFVSDASHELRTPIAVVKTELEGILRSGDYGPDAREGLVAALEECERLVQLAEDLLVIARASEGQLPVRAERLSAAELLESVRRRFSDRAAAQARAIEVDVDPGLELESDPLRLRQALGNLVDNALRHGRGEIMLRGHERGRGVELEVSDRGPGFAPEIAGRAFERFARGEASRGNDGAGLGLAIVEAIAAAHGGWTCVVDGSPGGAVRVFLPSASSQAAAVRSPA